MVTTVSAKSKKNFCSSTDKKNKKQEASKQEQHTHMFPKVRNILRIKELIQETNNAKSAVAAGF